jgi:hypothetical protein
MSTRREIDPQHLWAKAILYFERAYENANDPALFGLFFATGSELLIKSHLAGISPMLILDYTNQSKARGALLALLGYGKETSVRSANHGDLVAIIPQIHPKIDVTDLEKLSMLRNVEIHSGLAAFTDQHSWLPGSLCAIDEICIASGKTLQDLIGDENAESALKIISKDSNKVKRLVKTKMSEAKAIFKKLDKKEKATRIEQAKRDSINASHLGYHVVDCPICKSRAKVSGRTFGETKIIHSGDQVIERTTMTPYSLKCTTCGLELSTYAEMAIAEIANTYTKRKIYRHDEYYNISSEGDDPIDEYDNE